MTLRPQLLLLLIVALNGCSSAAPAPEATTPETTAGGDHPAQADLNIPAIPEHVDSPPRPWDTLSQEEKGHWMAEHVMPTMEPLFREYDPTHYASFSCATCHGETAFQTHDFTMPSASLPVLPGPTDPVWQENHPEAARIMAFMSGPVEETMRRLVGREPFNHETGTGFSCFSCHTHR